MCLAQIEGGKGTLIRSRTLTELEKLTSLVPLLTYWDDATGGPSLSSGNKGCLPSNLGPTLLRPGTPFRGKFGGFGERRESFKMLRGLSGWLGMNWAEEEGKPSSPKGKARTGAEEQVPEREAPSPCYEEEGQKGRPDLDPIVNQAKGLGSECLVPPSRNPVARHPRPILQCSAYYVFTGCPSADPTNNLFYKLFPQTPSLGHQNSGRLLDGNKRH